MLLNEIIAHGSPTFTHEVIQSCSVFIKESQGMPIYKSLPVEYTDIQRVKVRHRSKPSHRTPVTDLLDHAMHTTAPNITPRCVFAYASKIPVSEGHDLFYVLPVNGYKYMYNTGVKNSHEDIQQVFEVLCKNTKNAADIATDLIKYTYTTVNLMEGIRSESEILLYNIPSYYAVRVKAFPRYSDFINII